MKFLYKAQDRLEKEDVQIMKNFFLQVERVITFPASHIKELRKSLKSNLENILKFLFAGKDVGFDVLKIYDSRLQKSFFLIR